MLLMRNHRHSSPKSYLHGIADDIVVGEIEEGFLHLTMVCKRAPGLFQLLSIIPAKVQENPSGEYVVKVQKSDVILLMHHIRNPIRYACKDEYGTRLATYMILDFANLFKNHAEDLYHQSQCDFEHDMRSGIGKFREFVNYIGDRHPGRLPHNVFGDQSASSTLCFPNPSLLTGTLELEDGGTNYIFNSTGASGSILIKAARMRLARLREELYICEREDNYKLRLNSSIVCIEQFIDLAVDQSVKLKISCRNFIVVIREVMGDSHVRSFIEQELSMLQSESVVEKMQRDFDADQKMCTESGHAAQESKHYDSQGVRDAINALERFKILIDSGFFFQRFNQDTGILKAQQYFRCMSTMVESEIIFLSRNIDRLTAEDLRLFLHKTCGDVNSDINQLLAIHDYLVTGRTVDRCAVVRVSKSEIRELSGKVQRFVSMYAKIYRELNEGNNQSIDEAVAKVKVDKTQFDSWEESLLKPVNLSKIFTLDEGGSWRADFNERNMLLLRKIETHKLCDATHGLNYCDEKIIELVSDLFEHEVTSEKILHIFQHAIRNRQHEYITDIECSNLLSYVEIGNKISNYLPFCSLWLPLLSSGRYRTYSRHKGSGIREFLSGKRSVIQSTEFSLAVSSGLQLPYCEQRFVSGNRDADMLLRSFRVQHNISGFKERLFYLFKKYRLAWCMIIGLLIIPGFTVGVFNVLGYWRIVPTGILKSVLYVIRAIFDSTIAIIVLDTAVENVILLLINFIGLVIRILDFVLLGGLISRAVGFVFNKFYSACSKIHEKFIDLCCDLSNYGLKHFFYLLIHGLFKSRQDVDICHQDVEQNQYNTSAETFVCNCAMESIVEDEPNQDVKNKVSSLNVYDTTDILALTLNNGKRSGEFTQSLAQSSDNLARELYGRKPMVCNALEKFSEISKERQSTIFHKNYVRLRKDFFFLMNSYPEELRFNVTNTANPTVFDSYFKRRDVYDLVTAVHLQTKMATSSKCIEGIEMGDSARAFLENAHTTFNTGITVNEINRKIAALRWAVGVMAGNNISASIQEWEVLFYETKIERSCAIALMDCITTLQSYRDRLLSGKFVSKDVVSCDIGSNFRSYIRDTCSILEVIDKKSALRHSTASYRRFCEIMCNDFSLLEEESHVANKANKILSLNLGVMSSATKIKEEFIEFLEYFQNPKSIFLSLCVYQSLVLTGGKVAKNVNSLSKITDHALCLAGLGSLYEVFVQNEYSEKFLDFFWGSIFPRDAALLVRELVRSILLLNEDDVLYMAQVMDHYIYRESFQVQGYSIEELKSFFNNTANLFCTLAQIHLTRRVINKKNEKTVHEESLEFFLQQEEENCSTSEIKGDECAERDSILEERVGILQCATINYCCVSHGHGAVHQ